MTMMMMMMMMMVMMLMCRNEAENQHFAACRKSHSLDRKMTNTF